MGMGTRLLSQAPGVARGACALESKGGLGDLLRRRAPRVTAGAAVLFPPLPRNMISCAGSNLVGAPLPYATAGNVAKQKRSIHHESLFYQHGTRSGTVGSFCRSTCGRRSGGSRRTGPSEVNASRTRDDYHDSNDAADDAIPGPCYGAAEAELRNHTQYPGQFCLRARLGVQSIGHCGIGLCRRARRELAQYRKPVAVRRCVRPVTLGPRDTTRTLTRH